MILNNFFSEVKNLIDDKVILITGGTGTFGHELTRILLTNFKAKKIIIFSRDEFKQYNMKLIYPENKHPSLRYFIGDIRDYERLLFACKNVDIIFHAAAMKQVDTVEYNPFEAIKTNINGTENVIKAAILNNVKKVIGISTDKCVTPINLYGATKLCVEKLLIHANSMSGENGPIFSVLRYGNVFNSRGSVVPVFLKQKETGKFTITDINMTRFTLSINQAINFVLNCASIMKGKEVFVPKLPSYSIVQLAKCIDPTCKLEIIGKRPGEKIHESMISSAESHRSLIYDDYFVIMPDGQSIINGKTLGENCEYSSGNNYLIDDELLKSLLSSV